LFSRFNESSFHLFELYVTSLLEINDRTLEVFHNLSADHDALFENSVLYDMCQHSSDFFNVAHETFIIPHRRERDIIFA